MTERELRELSNDLHRYLAGVDDRERAAEKRHDELMGTVKDLRKSLERGLAGVGDGLRELAGAIRGQGRR